MNFRHAGKAIGGLLFPLILTLFVIALSLSQIMEGGALKDIFIEVISSQVPEDVDDASLVAAFIAQCSGKETLQVDIGGEYLPVKCEEMRKSKTAEDVAGAIFDAQYAKKYDCSFIDCVKFIPGIIATAQGNGVIKNLSYIFLALSVIFGAVLMASLKGFGRLTWFGIAVISVGVMYFPLLYMPNIAGGLETTMVKTFASNFLIVLVAGFAIAAAGVIGGLLKKK
ncbi:MAG: hypothetical protein HY364_05270 [Candidatus Aenigmarchaeota archaeon]|nr:hypothetical protein [Candidatus Aenigmarchaeota archaeon]